MKFGWRNGQVKGDSGLEKVGQEELMPVTRVSNGPVDLKTLKQQL